MRFLKALLADLVQLARDPLGLDAELTELETRVAAHNAHYAKLNAEQAAWLREFNAMIA